MYTYRNQAQEILDHIKANPGTCTEGIVSGTGWPCHLVEVATKLMVEEGLIEETGKDEWGDSTFETINRNTNPSKAEQTITAPFDPSPFKKAVSALSGLTASLVNPFSQQIANAVEQDRLIVDIAAIAEVAPIRVQDFYQAHHYSLEFIKAAAQAGAKLDEEDIKRIMERRPLCEAGISSSWLDGEIATMIEKSVYTFTVILPNSERREVKAAYMEVDINSLYFKDEDNQVILAFGPGHWVWAERVEEDDAL